MPTTKTITLFSFDELAETAKERARDWYRQGIGQDSWWSEAVLEDAARVCGMLGIALETRGVKLMNGTTRLEPVISFSGFSSQGDGASFTGSYAYKAGAVNAITAYAPQDARLREIAEGLRDVQRRYGYRLEASITRTTHHYCHELTVSIDVTDRARGRDLGADAQTVTELLRDLMRWIYAQLEREWDYLHSDASIDESIRINEYEFHEDGRRSCV